MRSIDQLQSDDKLLGPSVSDTLAFCIVAGDYLRAKRRRFPLSSTKQVIDNTTFLYNDTLTPEFIITLMYPINIFTSGDYYYLWDYTKEYVDDD